MRGLHPDQPRVVVLVEPAGPLNIGSVARLCANFAVQELRIVNPRCDHLGEEAMLMAVHGQSLLRQASLHDSLLSALADCRRAVATCGRLDHGEIPLHQPTEALRWLLAPPDTQDVTGPLAMVFGREDRGLSNSELRLCQRVLSLHSDASYPSLNLSHAVAVVLHELLRLDQESTPSEPHPDPAPAAQMNAFLEDAQDLLLEVGFLLDHTASARMAKVRDLLQRASTQESEVALLRGMIRQLRWAIRTERP